MSRISVIAAMAALAVAASVAPANAWGSRYHGGAALGLSVGFGDCGWDCGYRDYAYDPGFAVSIGYGPRYDYDYDYASYAYAPSYRVVRVVPRYRYVRYRPYDYDFDTDYAYYPYDDTYYGRRYAFGWSDNDWRYRRGFSEDRVRVGAREFNGGRRFASVGMTGRTTGVTSRTSGMTTRASVSERTRGESRTAGTSAKVYVGAHNETHAGVNGTVGRSSGSANVSAGTSNAGSNANGGKRKGSY